MKLLSGGWVLACHPTTFEPIVKLKKQLPGGYPPPSIILNPHPNANEPFLPAVDYRQMNGLALDELEEDTFDAVIIKGTIDALLCAGAQGRLNALRMIKEAYRVLKPTGKFICISHGGLTQPDLLNRTELFKEDLGTFKWHVETRNLPKPQTAGQFHIAYACTPQAVKAGEIWDAQEAQQNVVS